jgi:DNA-binding CsgD family transcriptional regulator
MDTNLLSDREKEVLQLVGQGKSNKEIALALFISVNTVKVHVSNIFQKLDVSSRTEATLFAIENGLILQPKSFEPSVLGSEFPSLETNEDFKQKVSPRLLALILIAAIVLIGMVSFIFIRMSRSNETNLVNELTDNRWVRLDNLPIPVSQAAAITYDSRIYLIGGNSSGQVVSTVYAFDIPINTWSRLADKPTPVSDGNAAALGELIYLPGGITDTGQQTSRVEVFNPRSNSWSEVKPLPQPLSNFAIEVLDGKLYIFGGINQEGIQDRVYSYDPTSDEWTEEEKLSHQRAYFDSTEWGGRIFLVGGFDGEEDLKLVESYYPSPSPTFSGSFRQELSLPDPAKNCKIDQLIDTLFVICPSKVMKFSPDRTMWITEPIPEELGLVSDFSMAYFNNNLFIMGGTGNPSGKSEAFFARFQALYSIMLPLLSND